MTLEGYQMVRKFFRRPLIEALKEAKKKIEQGFCQQTWARDELGNAVRPLDPEACKWCIGGALSTTDHYQSCMDFLQLRLPGSVASFNDSRTKEEVLKFLDESIEELSTIDRRESADTGNG